MLEFFDTQLIYRNLADKGGFSREQAEALTDALRNVVLLSFDRLATKDDVSKLEQEIENVENTIRSELKIAQHQLTIRLGGIMVVGIGVLTALIQIFG